VHHLPVDQHFSRQALALVEHTPVILGLLDTLQHHLHARLRELVNDACGLAQLPLASARVVAVVDGHHHFPEAAFAELCLDSEAAPARQNGLQAAELRARGYLLRKAACDVLQQVCCTRQTRRCEYLYFCTSKQK